MGGLGKLSPPPASGAWDDAPAGAVERMQGLWAGLLVQGGKGNIPPAGGRSWLARGLFTAQCSVALVFMSFVRFRLLYIRHRFLGVTSKVRKLWKEYFPHESHFPKCNSLSGVSLFYRADKRRGIEGAPGEFY